SGYKQLYKIIKDENCDKGTALFIYWMSRPEWYQKYSSFSEVQSHEKDAFLFLQFIEESYDKIKLEEIIYDPYEAGEVGLYENPIKRNLPEIMYKKTNGIIHYKDVVKK